MDVRLALLPSIKQFLYDYSELCPQSTVFSELHYLEEHIVKFVPKWKIGPGMMGKHGGESIYQHHLADRHSAPEPARKKQRKA